MKFTSDRQRRACFANMFSSKFNKFSDSIRRKVVVVAANFKPGGENSFINTLYNDPELDIKDIAIIDNNTKGMSEIYIDTKDDMAQKLAFAMAATPGPIRGFVMDESFDDIVHDPVFLAMGGHKVNRLSDVEIPSDVYSKSSDLQKMSDDKRYLKDQFEAGIISQKQYMDGINSLKQSEDVVIVDEEPKYEMTAEDYEDMYPAQKELEKRHNVENEEYLRLYGRTKDEIDYDFGDNDVMWTAEMGATSRNQYLDMLKNIKLHSHLVNNNTGLNVGKKAISRMASVRDNRVGSNLMDIYI